MQIILIIQAIVKSLKWVFLGVGVLWLIKKVGKWYDNTLATNRLASATSLVASLSDRTKAEAETKTELTNSDEYLSKAWLNITPAMQNTIISLGAIPSDATYCNLSFFNVTAQHNQDGDFSEQCPSEDTFLRIDSKNLIDTLRLKIDSNTPGKLYAQYFK